QVLGRSVEMLVPGSIGDLKDGFHAEAEGRRADGSRFPIDLAISEMCEGDRHTFIAIIRDITATRPTERPPRARQAVPCLRGGGRFRRGAAAALDGRRAGVAFPAVMGGEVRGVMELFARSPEKPEAEWLQMFAALGGQLGQFLERDEVDHALRGSNERMRAVVENMLEGLITISDRNIIEQVNRAAEQMFGYAAEELIGQHLKILMPRSTAQGADAFLKDAAPRALGRITEWEGRRKNGELFRFELSLFAFQTHEGRHFAGHLRDISERKKLERLKQEFVATVSHELRTPLTSIRGSLSLLTGGALGELPDEARDVVVIAERNTVRLITLINDLLDP